MTSREALSPAARELLARRAAARAAQAIPRRVGDALPAGAGAAAAGIVAALEPSSVLYHLPGRSSASRARSTWPRWRWRWARS
ncbi:MAG: hypothetical protein U1F43_10145 [Myxococcota bacterium]